MFRGVDGVDALLTLMGMGGSPPCLRLQAARGSLAANRWLKGPGKPLVRSAWVTGEIYEEIWNYVGTRVCV